MLGRGFSDKQTEGSGLTGLSGLCYKPIPLAGSLVSSPLEWAQPYSIFEATVNL